VVVELATVCSSAGDAFRSLDQKDLVKNTFVLVSGDVVTNMELASAYREHLARRLASPAAILTLVRRRRAGRLAPAVPRPPRSVQRRAPASTASSGARWQVMKAGTSEAQRRRLGEGGLVVEVDARSQRLLRYEEQGTRGAASLDGHCWGERDAVEARARNARGRRHMARLE